MRAVLMILVFWLSSAAIASAKWVEVKSKNFHLAGDVSESRAKGLVEDLEEYRAILFVLMGQPEMLETLPVKIFVARSSKDIKDMTGSENAAGVYRLGREGPVFVLSSKNGFKRGQRARMIAFHEYSHHLFRRHTNTVYPRWFDEGFSEYLSTFKVTGDRKFKLGQPDQAHAYALSQQNWIPMSTMLSAVRNYPYRNDGSRRTQMTQSLFYAQSWLAVHYINTHDGYPTKFQNYMKLLNQFDAPADAFQQSFGITPDEFGKILRAYHKSNRFTVRLVELAEDYKVPEVTSRKLSKGETEYMKGEAVRLFAHGDKSDGIAAEYYNKALANSGPQAEIYAAQALLDSRAGRVDDAITKIQAAENLKPNDSRILHYHGLILIAKSKKMEGGTARRNKVKEARKKFIDALRNNPQNVPAHYSYAETFTTLRDAPSKQAIASALEGLNYFRDVSHINRNMQLTELLIDGGRAEEARPILEKAQAWSRDRGVREYARDRLERIGN